MKTRDLINCQKINIEKNIWYNFNSLSHDLFVVKFSITVEFDPLNGYSYFLGKYTSNLRMYQFVFIPYSGYPKEYLKEIL